MCRMEKKKVVLAEEKAKELRKVTTKDIKDLANKIFINKNLNLALIGPFKEEKNFLKDLKF